MSKVIGETFSQKTVNYLSVTTNRVICSLAALQLAACIAPTLADETASKSTAKNTKAVISIDANRMNDEDALGSTTAANYSLSNLKIEHSVQASRVAVRKRPDDIEAHKSFAEALELQLSSQENKDPYVFQECLQEWLVVYRNEVGEEKGLGFHGVGIAGHLFEDESDEKLARQRLVKLAGRAPKPWETDARYIRAAVKNLSVVGKILQK